MKTVIVFFIITLISSYQVLAITPKIKYEREIQYQLDYMIREKAAADDLQRSMNASREHLQVWDVQEQIKRHIEETLWFEDAIRYKAQLHFEGAGILTDRYDMAKQAEADILPLVNSAINQVKIATALVKGKRNIRAQELIAMAYLEWY
ncbi:secreted protein, partial [methanotrophic bacterial endosymbiont of Bathymodiolus sp.]